jgi:hypothetical protein
MRELQPGDRVIALRNLGLLGEVSKGPLGTVVDRSGAILISPTVRPASGPLIFAATN